MPAYGRQGEGGGGQKESSPPPHYPCLRQAGPPAKGGEVVRGLSMALIYAPGKIQRGKEVNRYGSGKSDWFFQFG